MLAIRFNPDETLFSRKSRALQREPKTVILKQGFFDNGYTFTKD
jgi:hypothetical protein